MAHQLKEILYLGDHPRPPRPEIHGSPLPKALLQAQMHGEDMPDLHVYLVVEKPVPNNPQAFIRVREQVLFKTLKELKQACPVCGPTAPFSAQLHRTPPGDWMGIAKACPAQGNIQCGKLATQSYVGNKWFVLLLMGFQ
jgi:hypothetical protein